MELYHKIIENPEFKKLESIGGSQQYHQEGNAYVHSLMMYENSFEFWDNNWMNIIALLHDVGKVYTGRPKENGDWEYPNHAKVGAENLLKFIPDELANEIDFVNSAKFYIANHTKPLFWKEYPNPSLDNKNLARLAICDLKASKSAIPQDDKIKFLYKFLEL